jgi:UDP-GlcNAc:undecaprenyl-phosphate GlcNAc-1-phosphate transferase
MELREFFLLAAMGAGPSLVIAWGSLFLIRRWAPHWGLVDRPGNRKVHTAVTPLGGGLGVWCGVSGTLLLASVIILGWDEYGSRFAWIPSLFSQQIEGARLQLGRLGWIFFAGTILMVIGLIDDRRGLPWYVRLGLEGLIATTVVVGLDIKLTAFITLAGASVTLSVLWIVTLINVFNMLDNMDGLSGGVAAIVSAMLAGAMWMTPDPGTSRPQILVAGLLLVICGALLGFLWHNFTPSRIFLGDAGAYFIGFLLGVTTLLATFTDYQQPRPHSVLVPLCVMAVPLYDLFTVLTLRIREGRSPFTGDRRHFSHRLVDLGLSKGQAVWTIYLVTATSGLAALLLTRVDLVESALVLAIVVCVLGLVGILESTGWWRGRSS